MADSSNLISNVNWSLTFWKATNAGSTMHTLKINGQDGSKEVAAFWIYGVIEYAALNSLGLFKSWSLRLKCKAHDMDLVKENLQRRGVLGPD